MTVLRKVTMINETTQRVHCLKCDFIFHEDEGPQKEKCPHCNNADMKETVYMMPQDLDLERMLSEVFDKVFFKESEV